MCRGFYHIFEIFHKSGFSILYFFRRTNWFIYTRKRYDLTLVSLHLSVYTILIFSKNRQFFTKIDQKIYYQKRLSIFRRPNIYLIADYERSSLPPKWLWTDLFIREYFYPKLISTCTNIRQLAKMHFFWNFRPWIRVLRQIRFSESRSGILFYFIESSNDINRYTPRQLKVSWDLKNV